MVSDRENMSHSQPLLYQNLCTCQQWEGVSLWVDFHFWWEKAALMIRNDDHSQVLSPWRVYRKRGQGGATDVFNGAIYGSTLKLTEVDSSKELLVRRNQVLKFGVHHLWPLSLVVSSLEFLGASRSDPLMRRWPEEWWVGVKGWVRGHEPSEVGVQHRQQDDRTRWAMPMEYLLTYVGCTRECTWCFAVKNSRSLLHWGPERLWLSQAGVS